MPQILLVEDDPLISKSLKMSLGYKEYQVFVAGDLATAKKLFSEHTFDLLILDVNLPDGMSFPFCKSVREKDSQLPIIMLTARTDEESAVQGMTSGADDYVRKPFGINELLVRMQKLLERNTKLAKEIKYGPLKISSSKRMAWAYERELSLGKKEFDILHLLISKQGEVVTREEIVRVFGGEDSEVYDRTVDSHLSHLRKKLRDCMSAENTTGEQAIQITPVYGVGYRLEIK
jgi:DNA-binding response OmpR family regulator